MPGALKIEDGDCGPELEGRGVGIARRARCTDVEPASGQRAGESRQAEGMVIDDQYAKAVHGASMPQFRRHGNEPREIPMRSRDPVEAYGRAGYGFRVPWVQKFAGIDPLMTSLPTKHVPSDRTPQSTLPSDRFGDAKMNRLPLRTRATGY